MEIITIALGLGLTTGFHCIGMCGPIAITIGFKIKNKFYYYFHNLIYQLGRVITYSFLGAATGLIGESLNLIGIQNQISIIIGTILILNIITPKLFFNSFKFNFFNYLLFQLKIQLSKLIKQQSFLSKFLIGILNGFLPCGAVYIALSSALTCSNFIDSIIFMFFFGLGTIPAMFIIVIFGKIINLKFRNILFKLHPYIIILLGIILIMRGMSLSIPYISPNKNSLNIKKIIKKCCS